MRNRAGFAAATYPLPPSGTGGGSSSKLAFEAVFGDGTLGDVVLTAAPPGPVYPGYGGVKSFRSLLIEAGATAQLSDPLHAAIFRAQVSITIEGTIDATGSVLPVPLNIGDLLMGGTILGGGGGGGAGGSGGGGFNQGQYGNQGNNNGGGGAILGQNTPILPFGHPGQGGVPSPTVGGDGQPGEPTTPNGYDPMFLQQYTQLLGGWSTLIAGGAPGGQGQQGGQGGQGGNGGPPSFVNGGFGGQGGQPGNPGSGGGAIVLIAPTITIKATAKLISRGTNGTNAPDNSVTGKGQPAPVGSNAGGGGGGGGGEGGQGGCGGPIIIFAETIIVEPGATFDTLPGVGGLGGAGGALSAGDGTGFAGGTGGKGADATAALTGPILQVLI